MTKMHLLIKEAIQGTAREQSLLFPELIDDYVTEDNPIRFIDAFVDSLDLEVLGFQRSRPASTGRPSYHPRDLLKLYIYGYLNRIRSSRRLERETYRNVEVMWLLRKLRPDFKTIADFRKDNPESVAKSSTILVQPIEITDNMLHNPLSRISPGG